MSDNLPDIPGYEVESEIGRGGMGVVYRVRQRPGGALLALKMILGGRGATFQELARFRIEAEALACLDHPNIIEIRDVGLFAGYPFFALEFAERGSLRRVIERGPQPPRWSAELVRTLASAMQHAHERGMLHRDLKPANVLLMADGTPKVSDFGLVKFADPVRQVSELHCTFAAVSLLDQELSRFARELGAQYRSVADAAGVTEDEMTCRAWEQCAARTGLLGDCTRLQSVRAFLDEARRQSQAEATLCLDNLTQAGAVLGTPTYMAPEQAAGDLRRIGPHTDVYALGGILYELLTGHPPFRAANVYELLVQVCTVRPAPPRRVGPAVSGDLEAVCMKCLEKSPDLRYPTAAALAEDLTRFLNGYSPNAATSTPPAADGPPSPGGRQEAPVTPSGITGTSSEQPAATRSWWPFGRRRSQERGGRDQP
jgi:serine/threonine protein kinase